MKDLKNTYSVTGIQQTGGIEGTIRQINTEVLTPTLKILSYIDSIVNNVKKIFDSIGHAYAEFKRDRIKESVTNVGNFIISNYLINELSKLGLDESWHNLIMVIDDAPSWLSNIDGVIVAVNNALTDATNTQHSDLLGLNTKGIMESKSIEPRFKTLLSEYSNAWGLKDGPKTQLIQSGLEVVKHVIKNEQGKPIGVLSVLLKDSSEESKHKTEEITLDVLKEKLGG